MEQREAGGGREQGEQRDARSRDLGAGSRMYLPIILKRLLKHVILRSEMARLKMKKFPTVCNAWKIRNKLNVCYLLYHKVIACM